MCIRLAILLAAATVLVGGCAQSHLDEMSQDLGGLGQLDAIKGALPADVIYDKPAAPAADPAQPIKAAAWGDTTVAPSSPDKLTGWEQTTVERAPLPKAAEKAAEADKKAAEADKKTAEPAKPVKVADGWPAERAVSPVPVGPPVHAAPAPVLWGAAVVVTAGPSGGPTGFEPYILDTGDKLRVFVYGQPSLSRLYVVDQIGNIAIPLIGSVRARGRTTIALEHAIAAKLGREFVKDPQVTVDVAINRPFFILGEVRLPGQYPFVSGMTIEQAVAIGGGYTERASKRSYRITRKLGALVDQIEAPGDYPLCPGDTVFVYERWF